MKVKKLESQYIRKNGPLKLKIWGYNPKTHYCHMFYAHFCQNRPKNCQKVNFPPEYNPRPGRLQVQIIN